MRPSVLVTGAAGFLGSHLADRLLADGWEVMGVDNFSSGRRANLSEAAGSSRFKLRRGDLRRKLRLPKVSRIYHLASPASPPRYEKDPIGTLEVNAAGTAQLLALAARHNARFIYASTSEVYGDPQVHPQPERYWGNVNPTGPRSCYDEGKRYGEALCAAWRRARKVDTRIARIFNTYGPRMRLDDGRVVSEFIRHGLCGEPLVVHGTGLQTRSLCYVDDLIDGLIRLGDATAVEGPVNLGNPKGEISILELARRIRALTGNRSAIEFAHRPEDDPERRRPDIRRARKLLAWQPSTPLSAGLIRTIESFRATLRLQGCR